MVKTISRRVGLVAVAATLVLFAGAGVAAAATFLFAGSTTTHQRVITSDTATLVSTAAAWHVVPSTAVGVVVPTSTNRRIEATFNAESLCTNAAWCSVRIVIVTSSGAVVELLPASGTDFAFDSPGGSWEAHSVDRNSAWLTAGVYTVRVEARVISPAAGATFRLDDYSHRVKLIAP